MEICVSFLLYKYLSSILNFAFWPIRLNYLLSGPLMKKFARPVLVGKLIGTDFLNRNLTIWFRNKTNEISKRKIVLKIILLGIFPRMLRKVYLNFV